MSALQSAIAEIQADPIVLPRDIYKSKTRHYIHELLHISYFKIGVLIYVLFLTSTVLMVQDTREYVLSAFMIIICAVGAVAIVVFIFRYHYLIRVFNSNTKILFLGEVVKHRPSLDPESWNAIADRMNQQFYSTEEWSTPYYFYDGQSCLEFFRSFVIGPKCNTQTLAQFANGFRPQGQTELEMNAVAAAYTNLATEDYELEKFKERALEVYLTAVDEYLEKQYPHLLDD
ncbi:DUP/COS family protein KNAG_0C05530 [Huiozyma naganishii CBS 8797]|uniref:Uncharacterized protein n=1 Tax=Huiozyma naganishii (strain ATCC MYA-139 / BCRC 22969 / CBS 8797 / KCTC 17520 / NBRC 10181 / NCYC 3082 / Yp74L-3) TaxID=1071383 RepID=J7S6B3_HUIN7|nr:hypothetical protein KNAG_0C05530 [Kazachstania naganishii CBS 8797]CCK69651.1 hypothetical protein KNAG_0C05530 [Kazachstania naganishii CBS 8797]